MESVLDYMKTKELERGQAGINCGKSMILMSFYSLLNPSNFRLFLFRDGGWVWGTNTPYRLQG